MSTPKEKYNRIQRIVKEGLVIIRTEIDYIMQEQEFTELSHLRLKEIRKQVKRIGKAMTEIG